MTVMRLRSKLLLVLLPVVLAGLTLQWMVSSYTQDRQMTGQRAALLAHLLDAGALRMIDERQRVLATYGLESLAVYVERYQASVLEDLADLAERAAVLLIVRDAEGRILHPATPEARDRRRLADQLTNAEGRTLLDLQGQPYLAVVRTFAPWGWTIAAAYPMDAVKAAIRKVNLAITASLVLAGLCIALSLFVGVDRLVIGPLRQLEEKMQAFTEGQRLVDLRLEGSDELSELGASMDAMAHGIVAYTAELERSNSELDSFATTVGHDLRTPLRAIDTIAGWLAADAGPLPDVALDHLSRLRDQVARMDTMLKDLLHYAQASQVTGPLAPCDIRALVSEQLELLAPDREVELRLEGDLPILITPEPPLALVMRNLIANAIEHHDHDAVNLVIRVARHGRRVTFEVSDDGPGIKPAEQLRIFRLFGNRPGEGGHSDKPLGSGLGLALVRRIVQRLGGAMEVESDAASRGTTIVFDWPLDCSLLPTLAGTGLRLPTPLASTG
jgi:signal transduction histidine kinase